VFIDVMLNRYLSLLRHSYSIKIVKKRSSVLDANVFHLDWEAGKDLSSASTRERAGDNSDPSNLLCLALGAERYTAL